MRMDGTGDQENRARTAISHDLAARTRFILQKSTLLRNEERETKRMRGKCKAVSRTYLRCGILHVGGDGGSRNLQGKGDGYRGSVVQQCGFRDVEQCSSFSAADRVHTSR